MFPESIKFNNTYFRYKEYPFSNKANLSKDFFGFYKGQICALYISESLFSSWSEDADYYTQIAIFVNKKHKKVHRCLFHNEEDMYISKIKNYPCIFKYRDDGKIDLFEKINNQYNKILQKLNDFKKDE